MTWTKTTEHIYSNINSDVYVKNISRGKVYLRNEPEFPFTVSCGANSDRSFSGCFYGIDTVNTLEAAMASLDARTF